MYPEPQLPDTRHTTPARRRFRRRRATQPHDRTNGLFLQSLEREIDVCQAVDQPLVGVLMTEDFCWRSAVETWQARKPPRRHLSDYSAWRREKAELDEKQARIRELAADLGLAPRP